LCGGTRWAGVEDAAGLATGAGRCSVVQCHACSLCVTNPRPTAETIGQFYGGYPPHQRCGLTPARRRKATSRLDALRFWRTRDPQRHGVPWHGQGRLLDFGCGAGAFLELMHLKGWQVMGLDTRDDVVDRIRAELRLPALAGTLPHPQLAPESFDVVTLWHSLEHVHHPIEVLREVWRLLAPGGRILVAVPNIRSGPRRWFGPAWRGWSLPHHLIHFTPDTLRRMVETAGFQIECVRLPRNASWLRQSAEAARQGPGRQGWRRWLTWRFLARQAANYAYWTGQSDEVLLTAVKPPAATDVVSGTLRVPGGAAHGACRIH
jgi:SAM-dependent methyltransferase